MGKGPCINLKIKCKRSECEDILKQIEDAGFDYEIDETYQLYGRASKNGLDFIFGFNDRNEYLGIYENDNVFVFHWSPYYTCDLEILKDAVIEMITLESELDTELDVESFAGTCTM